MNYANIKYYDIANGPGVRTSVFVSGCRHHCPGCFNAVAWDFDYGQPFDKTVRNEVFASCQPDYIAGLSLLGGEPFEPENQRELLPFVRNFKALYPAKTVWCYSGYTWEQLTGKEPSPARCEVTDELLALLDVLVDGRFVQAEHDISLRFRGGAASVMNYATIKYYDIANGPGVRTSIFVSGCRHHCPGCFNEVAWDFGYGQPFDKAVRNEIFASCQPDYIAGISLLGGEPFEPENQRELLPFVRNFRALYPDKSVWCYSGYTWEQLTGSVPCPARCEVTDELLSLLDVLVDGRFVEAQHDISLRFRGSSNQRLLDVPKSLAAKSPVWWEDEQVFATHTM